MRLLFALEDAAKLYLLKSAQRQSLAASSWWSTTNRQPPKPATVLDASARGNQGKLLVLGILTLAKQRTRVVAGGGERRFLVPQHEAGTPTGYHAWRTHSLTQ